MNKKNLLSGRDKELMEMAEFYEKSKAEGTTIYMDSDDLADLADWYAMRHKSDSAQEVITYGLRLHPDNTELLVQQAYLYLEAFDREKAWETLERIQEETAEVIILRAQLLMEDNQTEAVEDLLNTITDKDDIANIIEVAYMYIDTGYPDKAATWLAQGKGKYDEQESYIAACADCCYALGQTDKAMTYYNRLIDKNPYSSPYWLGLARCYYEKGMLDKTIDACDYAILSDDEFSDAYILKGNAFYELGNDEKALENYKEAKRLCALSEGFLYTFQGINKMSKGEWQQAYLLLHKAIQANSSNKAEQHTLPNLFANSAYCLYKLGKHEEAENDWETAHLLTPTETDPYLIQGKAYMEGGKMDQAIACFRQAAKLSPYPETWDEIGLYCLNEAQAEYACTAFEKAKELYPSYEHINEKLVVAYLIKGDIDKVWEYNLLCTHPIDSKQLETLCKTLKEISKSDLPPYIKNLLEALS